MAQNAAGEQAVEKVSVQVSNVHISSPLHNDIRRAGDQIPIIGTVYGANRKYKIEYAPGPQPTDWFSAGMNLTTSGVAEIREGQLAVWDTSLVPPNQFYTLKLTATADDGTATVFLTRLIYLDQHLRPGWPQYVPIVGNYPPEDWRTAVTADLDGDGYDEIILVDHGNDDGVPARLLVYRYDGTLLWSKELASGAPFSDIPVVGDVDGDGYKEIFVNVGSDGQLFAFRYDGTPLPGQWPVSLQAGPLGKVLADLNGDGKKELIGLSQYTADSTGSPSRQLVVYDWQGNLLQKWDLPGCDVELDTLPMLPAVANLDDEPDLEIAAVSGCGTVSVYKLGKVSPIWSAATASTFVSSPVIGDLQGNGTNVVLVAAYDANANEQGGLYAFGAHGRLLPGWPVLVDESFTAAPALADFERAVNYKSVFRATNPGCSIWSGRMGLKSRAGPWVRSTARP